jgi:hypothetical protein
MNDTLTWLHLSDLHACPQRTGWDADRVLRSLARDLKELATDYLVRLDFANEKAEVWMRAYEKDTAAWQQRILKGKTNVHGVWHLDRLRCFTRRPWGDEDHGAESTGAGENFLDDVFDALAHNPVLLLLAQDGRVEREVLVEIKQRAADGGASVVHVTPPTGAHLSVNDYFAWLAGQDGLPDIDGPVAWAKALDERLQGGERVFLLVTGFERGADAGRRELGLVLRSLAERHGTALSVVLSGGERLAALKYEQGRDSLLNFAERLDWPELTIGGVLALQCRDFPLREIGRFDAESLLDRSGGHPRLLRTLFEHFDDEDDELALDFECENLYYSVFHSCKDEASKVREWLQKYDLGRHRPWLDDALLRRLYWCNALAVRQGRLVWRCAAVRDVGREVLEKA